MATLDFKQMSIAYGAAQAMVSEMERSGSKSCTTAMSLLKQWLHCPIRWE